MLFTFYPNLSYKIFTFGSIESSKLFGFEGKCMSKICAGPTDRVIVRISTMKIKALKPLPFLHKKL